MAQTSPISLSGNQDIDGILGSQKWTSASLTYSFPASASLYGYSVTGFEALNAQQIDAVRAILAQYSSVSGLTFIEIAETSTNHATIRLAEESNAGTAYAYLPTTAEQGGDAWFNHTSYESPARGTYANSTFMHELGHTLGLDHGHDGRAALPYNHDSLEYSVMTYRSYVGSSTSALTAAQGSFPQTLMMSDIAALQYLYGANYGTNNSDSVYTWSPTTGEMFINGQSQGRSTTNTVFSTIWDGGGQDTYDFSNYGTNLQLDLSPGAFSLASNAQRAVLGYDSGRGGYIYAAGNVANAYLYGGNTASLIENAVGGSGNDAIVGNLASNTLQGHEGNDVLRGGDGDDSLWGTGSDSAYYFINDADTLYGDGGNDFLQGNSGQDTLEGGIGNDILRGGPDNDTLWGTGSDPSLYFINDADTLYGDNGNDFLQGNSGNDTLEGGIGDDILRGGPDDDTLWGTGSDPSFYFINDADTLYGDKGNDFLQGNSGNDILEGGSGNDILRGGPDDDRLNGGTGADLLYGDKNSDTFVFTFLEESTYGSNDTICDFVSGTDKIDLSSFDADLTLAGQQDFQYIGAGNFSGVSGQLNFQGGMLCGDVNGDAFADFAVAIQGSTIVLSSDLIFG